MTQISVLLHLRMSQLTGQTQTKNGNFIQVSPSGACLSFVAESCNSFFRISCSKWVYSAIDAGRGRASHVSVQPCAHVSFAHYVALINLITVRHAQREGEDSAERVITLRRGFSPCFFSLKDCSASRLQCPYHRHSCTNIYPNQHHTDTHTHTYIPTCSYTAHSLSL